MTAGCKQPGRSGNQLYVRGKLSRDTVFQTVRATFGIQQTSRSGKFAHLPHGPEDRVTMNIPEFEERPGCLQPGFFIGRSIAAPSR
jgi:hypothetical protein